MSASLALAAALLVALAPGRAHGQANAVGEWKLLTTPSPINPIHVGLLRTGKVLIASGSENDPTHTTFRAAVWDHRTGTFAIQPVPWDLFCNAMSYLPDGRVLITGGNRQYNPFRGLKTTTIFDPAVEKFIQVQDMARGRWYPSNAALADGRTMTFSGWLDTGGVPNQAVEIYDVPTGWSPELNAPWTPPLYPWLHLLPSGKVFVSGSKPDSHLFDPASRTWALNVARTVYGQDRRYGSSVLLPLRPEEGHRPRVMIMGGNNPATASAEIIDLGAPTPAWRSLPPMSAARIEMSAVLLPTGTVLALGGSARDNDATTASLNADLFDPATETWSPAGRAAVPRLYHSVALLLPDATVWVAGSNPFQGSWDNRMEIYSPAYLFTKDATGKVVPAARPTITSAPARVGYSASFAIQTPDAAGIGSVVLVRPGSATHAFDFEQRLVSLSFTKGSGVLTVTAPPSSHVAPPGYYMLFLVNAQGVPSVARFVQLAPRPTNRLPEGTILSPATDVTIKAGQSVTFSGDGTDPDGSVTRYSWVLPGGSPGASTVPTPGAVTFATPGTYIVSLTVTDNLGDNDPSPPSRVITVEPPAFMASFTSPPDGATVNGTQTVGLAVGGGGSPSFTYTLKIDGTPVLTQTTASTSTTYTWDTTKLNGNPLPDGAHTLTLTVTDGTGQVSTATRTVTTSNATGAITVSLTSPSPGQTVSGTVWVNIWVEGAAGPYNYMMSAAGAPVWSESSANTHAALPWDTTKTPNGPQTLTVTVQTSIRTGSTSLNVTVQNGGSSLSAAITSPAEGATVSGATTVAMTASGGSPNYTFTLRIDSAIALTQSGPATIASYAWDTPASGDGAHTLSLTVTDSGGRTASATRTVTVNNSSELLKVALTSPRPGEPVRGTVWANVWVEAPYGTAPYAYTLTVAGVTVASQSASATHVTLAWDTTKSPGGAQTLTATVRDAAGRTGSTSINVTVQGGSGPAPLTAAFTSPAEGATVSGTVGVGLAASGGSPAYTYTLTVDGAPAFTTSSTATSATWSWDTRTAAAGAHTLSLTVADTAGGRATASRTVTVGGGDGGLSVALTSPRPGETVSGTVWANVWVEAPYGTAPYAYTLTVAGVTVASQSASATHVTLPWDTTKSPGGAQTLTATVRDAAGRTGSTSINVTVQGGGGPAPLTAAFTSPAEGATVRGTVVVGMTAGGGSPAYRYTLELDGVQGFTTTTAGTSASYSWDTTAAAPGAHTLRLTVTDAAGASATAVRGVSVDNSGGGTLTIALTTPRPGETVTGWNWANIWVDSPGTPPFAYTLSIGATTLWTESSSNIHVTLPWDTTRVPNGSATLTATVEDAAGRRGTATVNVVVQNP